MWVGKGLRRRKTLKTKEYYIVIPSISKVERTSHFHRAKILLGVLSSRWERKERERGKRSQTLVQLISCVQLFAAPQTVAR